MRADPRRTIRELVAKIYDPSATATGGMATEGLHTLIKFMIAQKPWSELVDLSGAVSMIYAASKEAQRVNGNDAQVRGFMPPREAWIDTVTDELLRYPRPYAMLIQLPGIDIPGDIDIALDGRARLIRSNLTPPPSIFGPQTGLGTFGLLGQLGGLRPPTEIRLPVCLEIKVSGKLDTSESCSAVSNALARAKQILQLLNLSFCISINPQLLPNRLESYVLGYEPERISDMVRVDLSEQLRQGFASCQQTVSLFEQAGSPQESIVSALTRYTALLSANDSNHDAIRVLTGLEWAFDAAIERNETQALLNACIGLEAVLGKTKETGLTDRLADRCAFMLGRGAQHRNEIAERFRKIYEVRSDVVHGRSRRLAPGQRGMLDSARRLLHDVLQREAAEFPAQQNRK